MMHAIDKKENTVIDIAYRHLLRKNKYYIACALYDS